MTVRLLLVILIVVCPWTVHGLDANNTTLADGYEVHAERACEQLVALGHKWQCDKFDDGHKYQNTYCDLFHMIRSGPRKMLEIGFGCGHFQGQNGMSALVWRAWFHKLEYYAIDYIPQKDAEMNTCAADYEKQHPGIVKKLWIGDQSDLVFLAKVIAEFSPAGANNKWDIIMDDGAHIYSFIKASFQTLWPHVAEGGVYVVEDMAADYKFTRVVAKWIERLSFGAPSPKQADNLGDFENYPPRGVKTIQCAYQICVFKKARRYESLPTSEYGHPFANAAIRNTSIDER